VEKNRLIWGSRRGMLELDLILLPFVENIYPTLEREDQLSYQRLLECEDQDMYAWFMHRQDPQDASLQRIVERVRATTGLQKS
jgi:antitoxin CptB